ncbi:putative mucin TcMUCII, partial [Trypanosoma cruzi]
IYSSLGAYDFELWTDVSSSLAELASGSAALLYGSTTTNDLPVEVHRAAAGRLACSYRAECLATEDGIRHLTPFLWKHPNRPHESWWQRTPRQELRHSASSHWPCETTSLKSWIVLLSLMQRGHYVNFMFSPSHCGIPRNEAADDEVIARSLPQEDSPIWHVDFLAAVRRRIWRDAQKKRRRVHRMRGACRCGGDCIPDTTRTSCHEWRLCAQARCDSCPLLDMPARALRITSNPLCRWCRPSLTAVTGPPLPPPEPLPDVSTATPCRPASGGLMSSCPTCSRVRSSVHSMRAHARRAQPGVPIVCEGLGCGRQNGATVFLTGASRTGRHRSAKHASRQDTQEAQPRTLEMDHERLRFIHCRNAPAVGNWECECLGVPQPARRQLSDGMLATIVRTALALPTRYCNSIQLKQDNNCFCGEYWLAFPWTNNSRDLRGFLFYCYFAFVLLCALHLLLCVCVPSVRGADTTDRSRRVCMRWSLVCRSCLLLPPPSVCWCCGRAVCVCACCRGLECVSCVVCGVRCMPGCCPRLMCVCPLCVCLPHLSSPLLLSMSPTVQISSTPLNGHTHDDYVPSAVRPVGARPVLLPVRVCGRGSDG